jgi:hypothetical protein
LAGFFFGIDFFAVHRYFKHTAAGGDQREGTNILFEPEKFFRQTDGLRLVVSHAAIFDGNLQCHIRHGRTAPPCRQETRLFLTSQPLPPILPVLFSVTNDVN